MSPFNMFQSSPSPKAGSYSGETEAWLLPYVSILSQPEGRELPWPMNAILRTLRVSILSQPEGRELR